MPVAVVTVVVVMALNASCQSCIHHLQKIDLEGGGGGERSKMAAARGNARCIIRSCDWWRRDKRVVTARWHEATYKLLPERENSSSPPLVKVLNDPEPMPDWPGVIMSNNIIVPRDEDGLLAPEQAILVGGMPPALSLRKQSERGEGHQRKEERTISNA